MATLTRGKEDLAKLQADNAQRSQVVADTSTAQNQLADLERLRKEEVVLREKTNELASLQVENRQLRARNRMDQPKSAGQIKAEATAKVNFQKQWVLSCIMFADDHGGLYPTNLGQMGTNIAPASMALSSVGGAVTTNDIELVYNGVMSAITNPATTIVLAEKESWNEGLSSHPSNQWAKVYGFADGHVEVHQQMTNNFDDYEAQHIVGRAGNPQ
jgi:hypothetical protein